MKSEYQIYMNFRAAQEQVRALNRAAQQMEELADTQIENTLNRISNNWTGENADAFLEKADQVKVSILRNATDIRKIAQAVDRISTNTRNAELTAVRIAQESQHS